MEGSQMVAPQGLAGVVVDNTSISKVMPETNSLTYRGYAVQELCELYTFEHVAYLIVNGELPNEEQFSQFTSLERGKRGLSEDLSKILSLLPAKAHPMDTLRTGISVMGCEDERVWDKTPSVNYDKFLIMLANIPVIIAYSYRYSKGLTPISPRKDLNIAENFFYMCFGVVPQSEVVKAFDVSLIL